MKISAGEVIAGIILMAIIHCGGAKLNAQTVITWSQLPPLPVKLGVAAPFVGTSGGALIVAGGANFPQGYPWQGGKKIWHDEVYALDETNGQWVAAGHLPRPLAYGVAVSINGGVLCIGGSDADGHRREVFELHWRHGRLTVEPRDPLPIPLAQACGAVVGDTVYVACGATEPGEKAATNRVFALGYRWKELRWRELEPCPGKPRILAVAAAVDGAFYMAGGAALEPANGHIARVCLRDTWCYRPGAGWSRLADLPKPSVAAPSPAPGAGSEFFVVGGDDGSLAGFQPVEKHPGFPNMILAYDAARNLWRTNGETPAPRATVPVVRWQNRFVIPSGEMRPGVRSPEVWTLRIGNDN
jgi:N-acetylneuraminate epimerase